MRGQFGRPALRRELAAGRAVEVVELAFDGVGFFGQLMHGPARVLGPAAGEFDVTLRHGFGNSLLSLFERQRLPEPMTVDGTHVVHADGRDGFHTRVDLRRTDDEAPTAANPYGPDASPIDERLGAQEIHRRTEALR